jgi:hypothetical protein
MRLISAGSLVRTQSGLPTLGWEQEESGGSGVELNEFWRLTPRKRGKIAGSLTTVCDTGHRENYIAERIERADR